MMPKKEILIGLVGVAVVAVLVLIAFTGVGVEAPAEGQGRLLTMLGIAFGTFVSEDLACISAGLLAASGKLDYFSAVLASFMGTFVGDLIIFWLGFHFGRPLLGHRWSRFLVSESAVKHAQHLFERHGIWLIIATRFIPGTRTATYFAAGHCTRPSCVFWECLPLRQRYGHHSLSA